MQFASIGSGSKGNGTLIRNQDTLVLVDCGFTLKEAIRRLAVLEVAPDQLTAILVTHEHSDHVKGIGALARKYDLPVFATHGTQISAKLGRLEQVTTICLETPFQIDTLEVHPVAVPHDAREPCQFIFKNQQGMQLGLLTDCGVPTAHMENAFRGCHALVLECNHDEHMLATGPYPVSLKRRAGGPFGHLNNRQAAEFLTTVMCDRLQLLAIGHISQQNNLPELAMKALSETSPPVDNILVIDQNTGLSWQQIEL